ncbi:MAG: sigma-54-dependent Fis family transcriptional regulator [Hyphomicrobiaceae bacterium]|nr:sigma-54-dependent Fis family transcriptional regulator [Hyphomicrobiaceae bacterium]
MTARQTILVIDDDVTLNRLMCMQLKGAGYHAVGVHRWSEARDQLAKIEPALALLDMKLPDAHGLDCLVELAENCSVMVLTAYGSIDQAVQAVKVGAFDYLTKPINPDALEISVKRALAANSLKREYEYLKRRLETGVASTIVGQSSAMAALRRMIGVVGPSDTTVLVLGESGVGKELVARAVHQASPRASGNYVAIDCSTLQANLFESELFGHERGAFTGADRRKEGLIEVGAGGTVFLDEIGEMSLPLQAKLLRVLETGQFRRVGGTRDLTGDVRFVAATNRNLEAMCQKGTFREDLYYRLAAFELKVAPLRERAEDIPALAEHFLQSRDFARNARKHWTPAALETLMRYDWPGNVRELRNIVERAALVSGGEAEIRPGHLGPLNRKARSTSGYSFNFDKPPTMDEFREVYLARLLQEQQGNRAQVAEIMGVSERSLYRMISTLREREGSDA